MPHDVTLIATLAGGFGLALIFGLAASYLKMPPLLGYLIAGVMIGPATPGFVADIGLSQQLAEIGVMLLMFGVGLHFSFDDLMAVKKKLPYLVHYSRLLWLPHLVLWLQAIGIYQPLVPLFLASACLLQVPLFFYEYLNQKAC